VRKLKPYSRHTHLGSFKVWFYPRGKGEHPRERNAEERKGIKKNAGRRRNAEPKGDRRIRRV